MMKTDRRTLREIKRLLLYGPCTLTGLRRFNKQNGWMAKE